MTAPKLFISYSWSSSTHEQWVIDLATELRESGVDVILDKWDLKEGSIEYRNKRLGLRRLSLRADMLKERSAGTGIEFRHLMQADFVAFLRVEVEINDEWNRWWPETLLYLGHFNSAFEVFARSASKAYFQRGKALIAIDSPNDLAPLFQMYKDGTRKLPRWEFNGFNPAALVGYEKLATRA